MQHFLRFVFPEMSGNLKEGVPLESFSKTPLAEDPS